MRLKEPRTRLTLTQPSLMPRETTCTQRRRKSTSFRLLLLLLFSFHGNFWRRTFNFQLPQCYHMLYLLWFCLGICFFSKHLQTVWLTHFLMNSVHLDFYFSVTGPECCSYICFGFISCNNFFFSLLSYVICLRVFFRVRYNGLQVE